MRRLILSTLFMFAHGTWAFCQSIWLDGRNQSGFSVEVLAPQFANSRLNGVKDLAAYLSTRVRLNDRVLLVGELPLAHTRSRVLGFDPLNGRVVDLGSSSELVAGSPYVGLLVFTRNSSLFWELGGRIPRSAHSELGVSADFDRFEAFYPDLMSFTLKLNTVSRNESDLLARLRMGPTVLASTDGGEPEAFLDYGLQVGYDGPKFALLAGATGRMWLRDIFSDGSLDRRTAHQLGLKAALKLGVVQPGIHFRMLFDEDLAQLLGASHDLKYVAGVHLGVTP